MVPAPAAAAENTKTAAASDPLSKNRHLRRQKQKNIDARANFLWRTLGQFLSADYNRHTKFRYTAMLNT